MAFPIIENTGSYINAGATSHTITLPTGIVAGELLVCIVGLDGDPVSTPPSGWSSGPCISSLFSTSPSCAIFYKTAAGSDSNPVLGLDSSEAAAAISLRISGTSGLVFGGITIGGGTQMPLLPITFEVTDDYLIMAVNFNDNSDNTEVTAYPTNYSSNNIFVEESSAGGVGVGFATRNLNATSDDPDFFTYDVSETMLTLMMAALPAAAPAAGVFAGGGMFSGGLD
jgi:hypothetical protein